MRENLNWAVLGTGVIANEMAQALQKMGKSLYAVGNRTHQKAIDFAEKYGVGKVYDQIDDMFEDENVDIIYITSPHNTHYAFYGKSITAWKASFCRKIHYIKQQRTGSDDRTGTGKEFNSGRSDDHLAYADL